MARLKTDIKIQLRTEQKRNIELESAKWVLIRRRKNMAAELKRLDKQVETAINDQLASSRRIVELKDELAEAPEYRLTCDIWGYEPGVGNVPKICDEVFEARSDLDAMRKAMLLLGSAAHYRYTAWERQSGGWERHRTAKDFTNSWVRIERILD